MIEIIDDMWAMVDEFCPDAVCITTCQVLNNRGHLVMGAGVAKQAKIRFPDLPKIWGKLAQERKDRLIVTDGLAPYALVAFPTKDDWRKPSIKELIRKSAQSLKQTADDRAWAKIFLPRPGCSNGCLDWESEVKGILEEVGLDDRFMIFSLPSYRRA